MHQKQNLFKPKGNVNRAQRELLNGNGSFTLWLTGLSGAGKTTLAIEIENWLFDMNKRVYILDGDNTRLGINSDLSFSDEDRSENTRRIAELCKLFNDAGIIAIAALISPFTADRENAKKIIGTESYVEAYVDASLSTCKNRDTKGLYKMAAEGKIINFTGIHSRYEAPVSPEIHLQSDSLTIEECVNHIKEQLIAGGLVHHIHQIMENI